MSGDLPTNIVAGDVGHIGDHNALHELAWDDGTNQLLLPFKEFTEAQLTALVGIAPVGATASQSDGIRGKWVFTATDKRHLNERRIDVVLSFGADPTGVADSTTALNDAWTAAAAADAIVVLPPGTYLCTGQLTPKATTVGAGMGASIIRNGASRTHFLSFASGSTDVLFQDFQIDGNSVTTSNLIEFTNNCADITCLRVKFKDDATSTAANGYTVRTGVSGLLFHRCVFDGVQTSGTNQNDVTDVEISFCEVLNWADYGLRAFSSASAAPSNIRFLYNYIHDCQLDGNPRTPISLLGLSTSKLRELQVIGNRVVGSDTPYITAGTTNGATTDQIVLQHAEEVTVQGNISIDGGDGGISVTQSSGDVVVTGNITRNNDSFGIHVGTAGSASSRVVVGNNLCVDNGQNRNADTGVSSLVGIRVNTSSRVSIAGNVCADSQGTPTQQHGLTLLDTTDCVVGPNVLVGNAVSPVLESGTNTNLQYTPAVLKASATLDFGSIAAGTTAELTVTVTGAATTDDVTANPASSLEAGLVWSAVVTSANTVTIRVANVTTGAIDPASRSWRVRVFKAYA